MNTPGSPEHPLDLQHSVDPMLQQVLHSRGPSSQRRPTDPATQQPNQPESACDRAADIGSVDMAQTDNVAQADTSPPEITTKPTPQNRSGQSHGTASDDVWQICQTECRRVTDRLRGLSPHRIPTDAAKAVHAGLQEAAHHTATVEGTGLYDLPFLEPHGLADQVMVIVADALATNDEELLAWLAQQLMGIRHRLAEL